MTNFLEWLSHNQWLLWLVVAGGIFGILGATIFASWNDWLINRLLNSEFVRHNRKENQWFDAYVHRVERWPLKTISFIWGIVYLGLAALGFWAIQ